MDAKTRRAITQMTGAKVDLDHRSGVVTGHYDDDVVYVDFGSGPEAVPTEILKLEKK